MALRPALGLDFQLAVGPFALEHAEPGREAFVERLREQDHVSRQHDGHQPDQGGQPQRLRPDMAEGDAHGDENDGELADLRHGQPGEKAGALAITHVAHDRHDDQRIADQHEQRQHDGRQDLVAERGEIQPAAEVDEEEQQHEVADAGQARVHRFTIGRRGQRKAGDEGSGLLAETDVVAQRGEPGAPGNGEDQQQFLRARHAADQRRQHVAHQHVHQDGRACQTQQQRARDLGPAGIARAAQGAHGHHRQHHGEVLDDQEADGDASVQRVQLVFVREQLDDDDGAGKGQRHGDVDCLHGALAHQQREREAEDDGEGQLPEPRGQRHRPDIADMREVQLEPDHEQQHGDADLGQQMDLFGGVDRAEHRRAKQNADHDVGNQQRLAQAHGNRPDHRGNDQQQGEFGEGAVGE